MARAYLRLDPAFDEHKYGYPDGAYAALIAAFCLAEAQPIRGQFRSLDYLARLLGKRGKWAKYLLDQHDLIELPDGKVYVDGWAEWQEGDWKVAERVGRIRHRTHRTPPVSVYVSPTVTESVTEGVTLGRLMAESVSEAKQGAGATVAPAREDDPALEAYTALIPGMSRGALRFLDELIAEFGQEATARAIGEAGKVGTSNLLSRAKAVLLLRERSAEAEKLREARAPAPEVKSPPEREMTPEEEAAAIEAYRRGVAERKARREALEAGE